MDLARFFIAQHGATHASDVYGARHGKSCDGVVGGLSDDEMRVRPSNGLNPLVWLLWHMARTEDVAVNLVVAARRQVFDDDWARRMDVGRCDMGTGMTEDEVAELTARAHVGAVRAYRSAVGKRTREIVASLEASAWDEIVTVRDTTRAADAGAFGRNDAWVDGVGLPAWPGHTRADQLGHTAIGHNAMHLGEAITIRGLAGLGI